MKIFFSALLILGLVVFSDSFAGAKEHPHNEPLRPQFHFSPMEGHLGAGIGLAFANDQYKLFYPLCLNGDSLFHIYQATSKDLIHWNYKKGQVGLANKVSLPGGENVVAVSVLADSANCSGLVRDGKSALLLFYTTVSGGTYLIYSDDNGEKWMPFQQKPLLPSTPVVGKSYLHAFWYAPAKKFYLIVAEKRNGQQGNYCFYSSPDLKKWTLEDTLDGFEGQPDFFRMQLERRVEDFRWVLTEGSDGHYWIGTFDGHHFNADGQGQLLNYSTAVVSPQSLKNTRDGRIIQFACLNETDARSAAFSGQLTFPVQLYLQQVESGYQLIRRPVDEISMLAEKPYVITDKTIIPGLSSSPVRKLKGDCFLIDGDFDLRDLSSFGFMVRCDRSGNGTEIRYDATKNLISCMGAQAKLLPDDGNELKLKILIDRSSIEIFSDGGNMVLTAFYKPQPGGDRLIFYNTGGEVRIKKLNVFRLRSIYSTK